MRAWWALAMALTLLLAGCGGKDKLSEADMERSARTALAGLREDVGAEGGLASVTLSGWVKIDTQGPFGPITVQVDIGADVVFGTAADVRVDGFLTKSKDVTFQAYCDPDRLVAVTQGLSQYGETDADHEMRNLRDACMGPGSEGLLASIGQFELIDPDILTGNLYHDRLEVVSYEQTGDGRFDATYRNQGPLGATDLVVSIKKGAVQSILASNEASRITMEMTYGERTPVAAPEAGDRLPAEVRGTAQASDDGWRWQGAVQEVGDVEDYVLHIFEPGTGRTCTGSDEPPIVTFDLGEGAGQEKEGFRMTLVEDGDGTLGPGDTIFIQHPGNLGQSWDYEVAFYDTWAQEYGTYGCSIPGPGVLPVVGLLALVGWAVRRR